jgi:hypothetical protein
MSNLQFVIAAFGSRYTSQLLPLIYSISRSNPQSSILLLWEDLPGDFIQLLQKSFPQLRTIITQHHYTSNLAKRISSKTTAWNYAIHNTNSKHLFFLDTDMLVLKNLDWLQNLDADIIFSETGRYFPINSGVIYCQNTKGTKAFFNLWARKTQDILNSPRLFSVVNDKHQPYGGADQMALMQLIKYQPGKKDYVFSSKFGPIRLRALPCEKINEIRSTSITDSTHVIHYKGGWRNILFYGEDFTNNRPKDQSWEMYITYLRTYFQASDYVYSKTSRRLTPQQLGLYAPYYLSLSTWLPNQYLYACFKTTAKINHYLRALINLISKRDINY